ncbi:hypothetical protein BWR60_23030 [Inquilinus limosus]|uniref:Uncharacterized protein n=2 Tax=Inquilinus limosus TaxID=171674 RepID=A0A211ZHN3_9PROT|nr:hypothetical protein BWR60_23030 [Inquilinus limosus]
MLDEHEWAEVYPALSDPIRRIKDYRALHSASLAEAKRHISGTGALDRYFALTGYRETDPDALWHHRLSLFGPPCGACGKPLRTPRAKLCAECGAPTTLDQGH